MPILRSAVAAKKMLRSFHFLSSIAANRLQPSPSSMVAITNVPEQWYRGYISQSIVSCLRLSVTLAIPYVSQQAQCKTARVKVRARSRCRDDRSDVAKPLQDLRLPASREFASVARHATELTASGRASWTLPKSRCCPAVRQPS